MERHICPECGGSCRYATLSKRMVCKECNTLWDPQETLVVYGNQTSSWEQTLPKEGLKKVRAELQGIGLTPGQIKHLLYQDTPVTAQEIQIMIKLKWGLFKTRSNIESAVMYGLIEFKKREEPSAELLSAEQ